MGMNATLPNKPVFRRWCKGEKSLWHHPLTMGFCFMGGWIRLDKKIKDKGYYKKAEYVHLWIYLLLTANHKETEFLWNGQNIILKPGQLLTGRKKISEETGIKETTIERVLKVYESCQQIGQQKTNKYRLITILNWGKYQITDNKRTTNGQQTDTSEHLNNINNKNTDLPKTASSETSKNKKDMLNHDNRKFDSDYEPVVNEDGEKVESPRNPNISKAMRELIKWAEERRGGKFINIGKQFKAMKLMRLAKISPTQIKERWEELESDKYYRQKGFDFSDLANSFDRKR